LSGKIQGEADHAPSPPAIGQYKSDETATAKAVLERSDNKKDPPAGPWQKGPNHLNGGN